MKLGSIYLLLILFTSLIAQDTTETPSASLESTEEFIIKGKLYHPGNATQFKNMINTFDLVVVDFYADWCHPCRQMHKVFDALAQDKDLDDILFVKIDTETHHALSNEYNIRSLPTIILFVDGKPIRTLHGSYNKLNLKKIIQETFRI